MCRLALVIPLPDGFRFLAAARGWTAASKKIRREIDPTC
jgi:hypothetical protein